MSCSLFTFERLLAGMRRQRRSGCTGAVVAFDVEQLDVLKVLPNKGCQKYCIHVGPKKKQNRAGFGFVACLGKQFEY